jgi:hypothetical protein
MPSQLYLKQKGQRLPAQVSAFAVSPRKDYSTLNRFCHKCGTVFLTPSLFCTSCSEPALTSERVERGPIDKAPAPGLEPCRICGGAVSIRVKADTRLRGLAGIFLGLFLMPFLVGLPILIYGLRLLQASGGPERHCPSCS